MAATLTDPATDSPSLEALVSLRPNRNRWSAMLERSTSALDVALRASLSADRRDAPLSHRQRATAAGAAMAGLGGVGGLAALAAFRPDLGPSGPAVLCAAVAAAGFPVALCIRRAVLDAARPAVAATPADVTPDAASPPRGSRLRRLAHRLLGPDRAVHRRRRQEERRRDRAVSRALADIAARERRLAKRIGVGDEPREDRPRLMAARPAAPASPAARSHVTGHRAPETDTTARPDVRTGASEIPGGVQAPWALPRDIAESLADLEARERLHDGKGRKPRRTEAQPRAKGQASAARAPVAQAASTARRAPPDGAAAIPNTRRHVRITPPNTRTFITTQDGRKLDALVLDVSQSGVAIEGDLPGLWIGSMVTVGSRRAKVVRTLPRGMAFEFSMPIPAEALTADFVL